jgi:hypothetical protein
LTLFFDFLLFLYPVIWEEFIFLCVIILACPTKRAHLFFILESGGAKVDFVYAAYAFI